MNFASPFCCTQKGKAAPSDAGLGGVLTMTMLFESSFSHENSKKSEIWRASFAHKNLPNLKAKGNLSSFCNQEIGMVSFSNQLPNSTTVNNFPLLATTRRFLQVFDHGFTCSEQKIMGTAAICGFWFLHDSNEKWLLAPLVHQILRALVLAHHSRVLCDLSVMKKVTFQLKSSKKCASQQGDNGDCFFLS